MLPAFAPLVRPIGYQVPTFLILNSHWMPAPCHMGGAYGFSSVGKFSQLLALNS